MHNPIEAIVTILSHPYVVLCALSIALASKVASALGIVRYLIQSKNYRIPLALLLLFLLGAAWNDIEYIVNAVLRGIYGIRGDFPLNTLLCRITWLLYVPHLQAMALFFEYLLTRRLRFSLFWKINFIISSSIVGCFAYLALGYYGVYSGSELTLPLEGGLIAISHIYGFLLGLWLVYRILSTLSTGKLPRILHTQIRNLAYVILPLQLLSVVGRGWFLVDKQTPLLRLTEHSLEVLVGLLSAYCLYYMSTKIMNLRFLNIRKDIVTKDTFNFLHRFRDILEQLSYATALNELTHLTQTFFNTAFDIRLSRTQLYIRDAHRAKAPFSYDSVPIAQRVEQFIGKESALTNIVHQSKIFIRDDVHFTSFYEQDTTSKEILAFLDAINADIFLPIYERSSMVGYCIVERDARPSALYTSKERDEMVVFTTYLSNVISLVKQSNLEALHLQKKELTQELYTKHQEINQYKELLRSFIRSSQERDIGLIFYKNRRFTCANESAIRFVPFDLNTYAGHPLVKTCTTIAQRVQEFKTAQTSYATSQGKKLVISGLPSIDGSSCILLLYYPELSDTVKHQVATLRDPSKWDYALYLETTKSGKLINQLIPGTTEALLNLKISLLSAALSTKAVLLAMPEEDVTAMVDILHRISLRTKLHTLALRVREKNDEVAVTLFGINKLIADSESLLEKLDEDGTLFINHIELLNMETQQNLAQYLKFGYFHPLKDDHKQFSTARIICASHQDLSTLVKEGTFSQELYEELRPTTITMPSFEDDDITSLAQGLAEQAIQHDTFKHLLSLSDDDATKLAKERPLSIAELKEQIHKLLEEKTRKHNLTELTEFDPAYHVSDPDIAQAVRLGKKALRDPRLMALLWHKFKNQNKIAQLLGVNRSSVNRRCQEYNLR